MWRTLTYRVNSLQEVITRKAPVPAFGDFTLWRIGSLTVSDYNPPSPIVN